MTNCILGIYYTDNTGNIFVTTSTSFRSNGIAAPYRNDQRQIAVNHVAEQVGSGTGTAYHDGVPGTGRYFGYGHNGYNGGYGGY